MTQRGRRGFTLIEMAVSLAILGIIVSTAIMAGTRSLEAQRQRETLSEMLEIVEHIDQFVAANGHLPCPSRVSVPYTTAGFGYSISPCLPPTGITGTVIAGGARMGGLPAYTLGLDIGKLSDGWERRYQYSVTTNLTTIAGFSANDGAITVIDGGGNTILTNAAWVLVSHGADGKGIFLPRTGAEYAPCGATANLDVENCDRDDTYRDALYNNGDVAASFFDDVIFWRTRWHYD